MLSDSEETTTAKFIIFGLTRPVLEPTIYHTLGEHTNNYTTDPVLIHYVILVVEMYLYTCYTYIYTLYITVCLKL